MSTCWRQFVMKSLIQKVNYDKLFHLRDFPTWRDFGKSRQQLLEKREPEVSVLTPKIPDSYYYYYTK